LAVIATDVGATQILVNSENGWLIPPGDIKAIYSVMNAALDTATIKLDNMRKISIDRMRSNFVWEEIAVCFVKWLGSIG